jgi:protein O-GlcNAc transferase
MILNRIFRFSKSRPAAADSQAREAQALLVQGEQLVRQGNPAAAVPLLERAVALQPEHTDCWRSLGVAYLEAGALDDADRCCRKVLDTDERDARALGNLGAIRQRRGQFDQAEGHYRAALEANPQLAQCWFNLGMLLLQRGQRDRGIENVRRALALEPGQAHWHFALGSTFNDIDRPLDARASLETALRLAPDFAAAHEELAGCLLNMGQAESAVPLYRRAAELDPEAQTASSNMLFALNYVADGNPQAMFREHAEWAQRRAAGLAVREHRNAPDPGRKLKVGYVSPDLRNHSVAYFLEPVLARHDRASVEVRCYSDVEAEDRVTVRLRDLSDAWCDSARLSNEELARRISDDRVDVLIDLAGHTAGGKRMLLFARKPAPVQASWLGYLNTTGLDAIDYRITDWHACPAGWERYHTEQLMRLPNSQWCYSPPEEAPDAGPLPALREGAVTFGAIQNFAKVTPQVIRLWSRVLQKVPGARLLIVAPGMEQTFELVARQFARNGVDPGRIRIQGRVPVHDYFALHHRVDINLDTFPYTGGTTTCHALWMGVPVVALSGRTMASRGGASVLNVVGLPQLVAGTEEEYVEIAAALSGDPERLDRLRRELRERVAASPLTDARTFVRDLEAAYRAMWRQWCLSATAEL